MTDITLIVGATGFIGSILLKALHPRRVRRAVRQPSVNFLPGDAIVGDISPYTNWENALAGVDCVVHLAARTHVMKEDAANALPAYRHLNVESTRRLAQLAAVAGVRRFVFMSSIKVNGEATPQHRFTESDTPAPRDAYGTSKWEAEMVLHNIARRSGMELVILRPPLVYGPGVKGNFLRLLRLVDYGIPLPLASIRNQRSMIHVVNLAEAIVACIDSPAAAGKTFLVGDAENVSTPELIRKLATGMGRPARLLPCPVRLLELCASLAGQRAAITRLTRSLAVDTSCIQNTIGWHPRIPLDQGLIDTAQWYYQAKIQGQT